MRNKYAVTSVVIATGISSVVTQLLTIREFLAQFSGNEFVIALILFDWLLIGGIGTLFARFYIRYFKRASVNLLGWFSISLSCIPVVQIIAIRRLRDIFFIPGSSVGFYPTLSYTFLTIAPYCLIVGFVLPYSLFVIRKENPGYPGACIYITDNLGDVAGGILFSFFLVYIATPMQALFLSGSLLLITSILLFPRNIRYKPGVIFTALFSFVILLLGILTESYFLSPVHGELEYYKESRYGRIEVHKDKEQFTLFEDGIPVFSSQNLFIAEETIHYPMVQVENPRNVLLISAEGGMIEELKKYHLDSIDYVELNPELTRIEFKYGLIQKIPVLNVIHNDGRAYLKETSKIYDAIIVNLPEPDTFQINRFFTDRFFSLAKKHIRSDGVLSFSMKGYGNYLAKPQQIKLSSLYNTASVYFNNILLLPGEKIFFVCSNHTLVSDIPSALAKKGISTSYVMGYYYGNITDDRIEQLNGFIDRDIPRNTDQFPYMMQLAFLSWFSKFSTSPVLFSVTLVLLCLIYLYSICAEEFVLFSTGCMTMGSEILVIFAFQIFFGYIYLQIGIIITVFLAGLMPGAWFGDKLRLRLKPVLILTDGILVLLMGLFIFAVSYGGDNLPVYLYFIFGFTISMACGFQFPVALSLKGSGSSAATNLFSADLMGAAFGTLITSVVLIPYFGIIWAAASLIALKLISMAVVSSGGFKA